jgi:hypothetical protein
LPVLFMSWPASQPATPPMSMLQSMPITEKIKALSRVAEGLYEDRRMKPYFGSATRAMRFSWMRALLPRRSRR